jgi:hypothetical protein
MRFRCNRVLFKSLEFMGGTGKEKEQPIPLLHGLPPTKQFTKKDAYPLLQINVTLDKLRGAKYLSTIDLKSGYW